MGAQKTISHKQRRNYLNFKNTKAKMKEAANTTDMLIITVRHQASPWPSALASSGGELNRKPSVLDIWALRLNAVSLLFRLNAMLPQRWKLFAVNLYSRNFKLRLK